MDKAKVKKMWAAPLTAKTTKYYAIMHFINPEKTWNAYFKAMKSLENLVSYITSRRFDEKSFRKSMSLGNEISESFSKEAATRMIAALVPKECLPEAKTLLEWLGIYWKHSIPEVDLNNIPWSIELAEKLEDFSGKKS